MTETNEIAPVIPMRLRVRLPRGKDECFAMLHVSDAETGISLGGVSAVRYLCSTDQEWPPFSDENTDDPFLILTISDLTEYEFRETPGKATKGLFHIPSDKLIPFNKLTRREWMGHPRQRTAKEYTEVAEESKRQHREEYPNSKTELGTVCLAWSWDFRVRTAVDIRIPGGWFELF